MSVHHLFFKPNVVKYDVHIIDFKYISAESLSNTLQLQH